MVSEPVPPDAKAEIADAVRKSLSKHGYARLTTAKIAAESEKSEAGLYYHYDSKDEMIVAFLETATGVLRRELEELDAAGPEARLRRACDRLMVGHEETERRGVNVAVMELLSHSPHNEAFREPLLALQADSLDALTEIVESGIEAGVFRPVDPRGTAAFLLAAANGATGFYLALGMEDLGDLLRERLAAYVDSLLADGPSTPKSGN